MAVVTLKYIQDKGQIKANLRYFTHRKGREQEKITRAIFTNVGETEKQEFYRQVRDAGRGTVFFKFMISPDPKREDSGKNLDLPYITRRTIRKLEQAIGRRLYFVAAVHNADHTPIRHVHGIFLTKGKLSREHFRLLQEVARAESTREALLQRQARDLICTSPRYQVLSRIRREVIRGRGGGRVAKVQPGCRDCGFGEFSGIPGNRTHCPLCHASLRQERQPRFRLQPAEGRRQ
jgi:predicted Zn-ribbon and HTH transcriptional regulator